MFTGQYVFTQLTHFLPQRQFGRIVAKYPDRTQGWGFSHWNHLLVVMYGQLDGCNSLRELTDITSALAKHSYHLGFGDTPVVRATLSKANTWQYTLDNSLTLHKHKMDYESDGGQLYFDADYEGYWVNYVENIPEYFCFFRTWVYKRNDILPIYTMHLDDTLMTISFPYTKFDVLTWQHFIDIVDRETKIDTPDRVYKLKNPQTDSIECIIETKKFPDGNFCFKMEIL